MSAPDLLDAAIRRACGCYRDPVVFGHDPYDHRTLIPASAPHLVVTVQWRPPLWPLRTRTTNA